MIVKLLIFLCSMCVVNAYVAINIFDDDADSQVPRRIDLDESPVISECSPLGCAQLCRRIGLKGGVCVHGKCKCDLFIDSADTDDTQTSMARCDRASCNRGCRSIGYPGGRCVGSQCRCDPNSVKHHVENVDDATETETPLEKCHSSSCNLKCRSLGFVGGFCIAKRCICLPRSAKAEDSNLIISSDGEVQEMKLENPSPMLSDCNIRACEQLCRRIFLKGGSCVNGQCKCDIVSNNTETNEVPLTNNEDKDEETNEVPLTKNEDKDEETALDDDQKSLVGTCSPSECNQMCRRIGFRNGRCDYNGACTCY